jgi:hypothetical protein
MAQQPNPARERIRAIVPKNDRAFRAGHIRRYLGAAWAQPAPSKGQGRCSRASCDRSAGTKGWPLAMDYVLPDDRSSRGYAGDRAVLNQGAGAAGRASSEPTIQPTASS